MKIVNRIYNSDAREILKIIKNPIVDVVITSPPYADLKDYGIEGQIGYGQNYETEYLPSLKNVFLQCYAVTKETGAMWVVVDTFKKNGVVKLLPFEISNICIECGWLLRDLIVWDKGKTLPWSRKGQLRNRFEYILFFTKSNDYKYYVDRIKDPIDLKEWWVKYPERYSLNGKNPGNIWTIPIPVQGSWSINNYHHFCPFPTDLVEKFLLISTDTNDIVLDPFAGSGIVLARAKSMNRKYLGFEINKKYVQLFKKTVLPGELKKWKQNISHHIISKKREELEQKIGKLRILKFPKVLMKSILDNKKKWTQQIIGIYLYNIKRQVPKDNKFAAIKILIIVKNSTNILRIKNESLRVIDIPPLSKYGIDAEIEVIDIMDFRDNVEQTIKHKNLYLYLAGQTHFYAKQIPKDNISNILENFSIGDRKGKVLPPIISQLRIRQEIVKTWNNSRTIREFKQ